MSAGTMQQLTFESCVAMHARDRRLLLGDSEEAIYNPLRWMVKFPSRGEPIQRSLYPSQFSSHLWSGIQ